MESGSPWGHAFFAEDKDSVIVVASEHKYRPVFVAVKDKPGPGVWPLVLDRPQHIDPIMLIEYVRRVNEQESPIFFCLLQIPKGLHRVDAAVYACFKASTELVDAAGLLGFSSCHKEEDFCRSTAPSFANAYWTDTWAYVQGAKPP
jgi:hypothetical protein